MDGVSSAAPDGDNSRYSTDTISSKITIAPRLGFRSAIRHKSSIILDSISLRLSRDGFGSRRIKGGSPFVRSQSESPEKDKKRWYHSLRSRRSLTLESNDSGKRYCNHQDTARGSAEYSAANADPADAESEPPTSPTPFTPTKGFSHVVQSIRKRIRAEVAVDRAAHGGVEGILGSVPDKPARAPEIERPVARVELPSIVDRNNTFRMRTERAFQGLWSYASQSVTSFSVGVAARLTKAFPTILDIDTKYKFDNFILDTCELLLSCLHRSLCLVLTK